MDQYVYFSGVLQMLANPDDEWSVIAASIELSKCAFLGFSYPPARQAEINQILDNAIMISTVMSEDQQH